MTYVTNSPAETEALGQRLAERLQPGDVIEWNYTCDLGCDLENGDPYGYGKEWKDNHD